MRPSVLVAAIALAMLLTGCSTGAHRIDAANRAALRHGDQVITLLAAWDKQPKEWLLISDYRQVSGVLMAGSRLLTFDGGNLDDPSRETVDAGEEMIFNRFPSLLAEHAKHYQTAASKKQRWTWEIFSTNINPAGLAWQSLGTREVGGEPLQLYRARVTRGCAKQSDCVFSTATAIVGLTADQTLRFEFLENTGEVVMARWLLYWHDGPETPVAFEKAGPLQPQQREVVYTAQRDHLRQALDEIRPMSP